MASTLEFARALPAPNAPAEHILTTFRSENVASGSLTAVPYGGFSSSATVALDLNAGRDRHDRIIPPGSSCAKGSSTDALPPISSLLYVLSSRTMILRFFGLMVYPELLSMH